MVSGWGCLKKGGDSRELSSEAGISNNKDTVFQAQNFKWREIMGEEAEELTLPLSSTRLDNHTQMSSRGLIKEMMVSVSLIERN